MVSVLVGRIRLCMNVVADFYKLNVLVRSFVIAALDARIEKYLFTIPVIFEIVTELVPINDKAEHLANSAFGILNIYKSISSGFQFDDYLGIFFGHSGKYIKNLLPSKLFFRNILRSILFKI